MTSQFWSNIVRGVALGDAWGDPNEFSPIEALTRHNPQGPEMPDELRITDDTQMTLYLAKALAETWGQDMATVKAAIAGQFKTYQRDPDNNRAPGMTVMSSLGRLDRDGLNWQRATSSTSDGSGTVMRTSPCAFLPEDRWVGVTAYAAAITHGTANAIAAAILNVAILRDLMAGKAAPGSLVRHAINFCENTPADFQSVDEWLEGFMPRAQLIEGFQELVWLLKEIRLNLLTSKVNPWYIESDPSHWANMGGGWRSHETLVIALACVDMLPGDPMAALRRSVTTDGDSDTIGAVAGGLLGAAFPGFFLKLWNEGLAQRFERRYREEIEQEADTYPFEAPRPPLQWVSGTATRRPYWRRLIGLFR